MTCLSAESLQSCLTLCDPMDCVARQRILQAGILEWVTRLFSRGIIPNQGWNPTSLGS